MLPYIIVFIINFFLGLLTDKFYYKNRFISILCLVIIGLINTIFVGFRDFGVGYDTNLYINAYFNSATNITSIRDFLYVEDVDRGFLFLACISHYYSNDSQSLLVVTELFIITFTLLGLYYYKKKNNLSVAQFLVFYWLILFFFSENFMRQYCAMSLLFFGYSQFMNDRKLLYVCIQILAFFFHSSSLFFAVVPVFTIISKFGYKKRLGFVIIVNIFFLLFVIAYSYFLPLLGSFEIVSEIYVDRYSGRENGSGRIFMGVFYLVSIYIQYIIYRQTKQVGYMTDDESFMYINLLILTIWLRLLCAYDVNLDRMALYVEQIYLVYLSLAFNNRNVNSLLKTVLILIMLRSCIRSSFNPDYEPQNYTYSSKILEIY